MVGLRSSTLSRIGATQAQLDGLRADLHRLDELCRDLEAVGQALEGTRGTVSNGTASVVADLELTRLERELESEVRQCLTSAAKRQQ